jgi:O-antigen/teichoic acid export membrane protein
MSRLAKNLGGLLGARAWNALLLLGLVPLYIRLLGIEAYGVVGAFVTLQSFISLLDLGLGTTLTRELARVSGSTGSAQEMRDLLRTLEALYLLAAVAIAAAVAVLAPLIATHWLNLGKLSPKAVERALIMAGLALAVQWPKNLYSSGLDGLQKQASIASLTAIAATLRAVFTVLALEYVAPTLESFFLAQFLANLIQTILFAAGLWSSLPRAPRNASFSMPLLRAVRRFASGMTGISITSVALTQLDKAVLSKTLPLKAFGYYVIASTLAGGLYVVVSPMFAVVFPRLAQLVSQNREEATAHFYDVSSQLMSVVLLPITAVTALFAPEVLQLWTRNPSIVANGHGLLSLVIIGNAMNGLMNVPYAMQLAHGWTALALWSNVVAIAICVPLTYMLSLHYGAEGGATVWVLLTLGYILCSMPVMHRKLLRNRLSRWYLLDVGAPAVVAFAIAAIGRVILPRTTSSAETVLFLVGLAAAACAGAAAVAPDIRRGLVSRLYAPGSAA